VVRFASHKGWRVSAGVLTAAVGTCGSWPGRLACLKVGSGRRASGLGGWDRVVASEAEWARVNITRALRVTIERLAVCAPRAAAHLRASIRPGGACGYDPRSGRPEPLVRVSLASGGMLLLMRKKLSGSYAALIWASRA
jgi:hypothetical protein